MKQAYIVLLALLIGLCALGFRVTHHPVYSHCKNTPDGYTCTLTQWKGNK